MTDTPTPQAIRASRRKLLLILACFGIPLLLATIWLQVLRANDGTIGDTSRGQLVQPPLPLEDFALRTVDGETYDLAELRGSWTLLTVPAGECDERCARNLYHMRQVRLALNHRMDRVDRVVLPAAEAPLPASLIADHPGLTVLQGDAAMRASLLDQIARAEAAMDDAVPFDGIYLVDPNGNLMLRFDADLDPRAMLKDLKHLLKVSRIG